MYEHVKGIMFLSQKAISFNKSKVKDPNLSTSEELFIFLKPCIYHYEKSLSFIVSFFFICGAIISFYHFGIEQGFFSESLVCDLGSSNKASSAQDLLKQLEKEKISCKDVTFKLLGFSLATFNTIISIIIGAIMFKIGMNYENK